MENLSYEERRSRLIGKLGTYFVDEEEERRREEEERRLEEERIAEEESRRAAEDAVAEEPVAEPIEEPEPQGLMEAENVDDQPDTGPDQDPEGLALRATTGREPTTDQEPQEIPEAASGTEERVETEEEREDRLYRNRQVLGLHAPGDTTEHLKRGLVDRGKEMLAESGTGLVKLAYWVPSGFTLLNSLYEGYKKSSGEEIPALESARETFEDLKNVSLEKLEELEPEEAEREKPWFDFMDEITAVPDDAGIAEWTEYVTRSAKASGESLVFSLPDMLAMSNPITMGPYGVGMVEGMAGDIAEADGRTEIETSDYAVAVPATLAVMALERFSLSKVLGKNVSKLLGIATEKDAAKVLANDAVKHGVARVVTSGKRKQAARALEKGGIKPFTVGGAARAVGHVPKSMAIEGTTEGIQGAIEYMATVVGTAEVFDKELSELDFDTLLDDITTTNKKFDRDELTRQVVNSIGGGIAGGTVFSMPGAVSTALQGKNEITNPNEILRTIANAKTADEVIQSAGVTNAKVDVPEGENKAARLKAEIERTEQEFWDILKDPDPSISSKTFDQYGNLVERPHTLAESQKQVHAALDLDVDQDSITLSRHLKDSNLNPEQIRASLVELRKKGLASYNEESGTWLKQKPQTVATGDGNVASKAAYEANKGLPKAAPEATPTKDTTKAKKPRIKLKQDGTTETVKPTTQEVKSELPTQTLVKGTWNTPEKARAVRDTRMRLASPEIRAQMAELELIQSEKGYGWQTAAPIVEGVKQAKIVTAPTAKGPVPADINLTELSDERIGDMTRLELSSVLRHHNVKPPRRDITKIKKVRELRDMAVISADTQAAITPEQPSLAVGSIEPDTSLDKEYAVAYKDGDTEKGARLIRAKAEREQVELFKEDEVNNTTYEMRKETPPKRTVKAYRKVYLQDGEAYTNFVGNGKPLPMGVWLNAKDPYHYMGIRVATRGPNKGKPTGVGYYVPTGEKRGGKKAPSTGGRPSTAEQDIRYMLDNGMITEEQASEIRQANVDLREQGWIKQSNGKVDSVRYRPGFHGSSRPYFPQGGKKDLGYAGKGKGTREHPYPNKMGAQEVIMEVELDMEQDYSAEAQPYPVGLERLPAGGGYQFQTNSSIGQDTNESWYISGAVKHNRILSPEETAKIMEEEGLFPQQWEEGGPDWQSMGARSGKLTNRKKLPDPFLLDDNGELIPLSQRMNPRSEDPRFAVGDPVRDEKYVAIAQYASGKDAPSETELTEAVRQYRQVEADNAEALRAHDEDGKPLPASNGEPSNLNREQWILTRTDNFKRWFGDSKVVDDNGDPLVVYHGTEEDRKVIEPGYDEPGAWFTTNYRVAGNYTGFDGPVIGTHLNVKNPLVVEFRENDDGELVPIAGGKELPFTSNVEIVEHAEQKRHDGVHFPDGNFSEDAETWVVFDSNQIKSSEDNVGTYSERDDIRFAVGDPVLDEKHREAIDAVDAVGEQARETRILQQQAEFARGEVDAKLERKAVQFSKRLPSDAIVYPTVASLPFEAPANTKGAALRGNVYLVTENLNNVRDAREIYAHEKVGHLRAEEVTGYQDVIDQIIADHNRPTKVAAIWKDELRKRENPTSTELAKEVVAVMAQQQSRHPAIRRLVHTYRKLLRSFGAVNPTEAKIYNIIEQAYRREDSNSPTSNGVRLAVTQTGPARDLDDVPWSYRKQIKIQDDTAPIREMERAIGSDIIRDTILNARSYNVNTINEANDRYVFPLLKAIKKTHRKDSVINEFLHARTARETNESLRKRSIKEMIKKSALPEGFAYTNEAALEAALAQQLTNVQDADTRELIEYWRTWNHMPSGMNDTDAENITNQWSTNDKMQAVGQLADDLSSHKLRVMRDSGLINHDAFTALSTAYQHYVPLYRDMGKRGEVLDETRKLTGITVHSPLRIRKGSTREVVDIIGNLVTDYQTALLDAERNKIFRTMVDTVQANPNPYIGLNWTEEKVRLDSDSNILRADYPITNPKETISGFVNGKVVRINANTEYQVAKDFVEAVNNAGPLHMGPVLQAIGRVMRFFAKAYTQWSPDFLMSNPARDIQQSLYNVAGKEVGGVVWGRLKLMGNWPKAGGEILLSEAVDKPVGKFGHIWREMKQTGANVDWADLHPGDATANLSSLRRQAGIGIKGKAVMPFRVLGAANTGMENATRAVVYKAAKEALLSQGTTQEIARRKSARLAREVTADFLKRGQYSKYMNLAYLFSGAAIQSTAKSVDRMKSGGWWTMITGTIVMATGISMFMRSISGDDDDDGILNYDEPSVEFAKERGLILPNMLRATLGKDYDGIGSESMKELLDAEYSEVPLPYLYNTLWVLGNEIAAHIQKAKRPEVPVMGNGANNNGWYSTLRVLTTLIQSASPITGGSITQTLSPTSTDLIVQMGENKNAFGTAMRKSDNYGTLMEHERSFSSTPQYFKTAAEGMHYLLGGDEGDYGPLGRQLSWLESPEFLRAMSNMFGGGVYATAERLYKASNKEEEEVTSNDVPIARRFFQDVDAERDRTNKWFAISDQMESLNKRYEAKDTGGRAELKKEEPLRMKMLKAYKKHRSEIKSLQREAKKKKEGSLAQQTLEKKIKLKTEAFIKSYNRTVSGG